MDPGCGVGGQGGWTYPRRNGQQSFLTEFFSKLSPGTETFSRSQTFKVTSPQLHFTNQSEWSTNPFWPSSFPYPPSTFCFVYSPLINVGFTVCGTELPTLSRSQTFTVQLHRLPPQKTFIFPFQINANGQQSFLTEFFAIPSPHLLFRSF